MEHDAGPTSFTGFENKAFYNMMYCITVADHSRLCLKGKSTDSMMLFSVYCLNYDMVRTCEGAG